MEMRLKEIKSCLWCGARQVKSKQLTILTKFFSLSRLNCYIAPLNLKCNQPYMVSLEVIMTHILFLTNVCCLTNPHKFPQKLRQTY